MNNRPTFTLPTDFDNRYLIRSEYTENLYIFLNNLDNKCAKVMARYIKKCRDVYNNYHGSSEAKRLEDICSLPVHFIEFGNKAPNHLTYVTLDKFNNFDNDKRRTAIKPARLFKLINYDTTITASDIEKFALIFQSLGTDNFVFEIDSGFNVFSNAYNSFEYKYGGSLNGSCMIDDNYPEVVSEFYSNIDACSILTVKEKDSNLIAARGLVWTAKCGSRILDKLYVYSDFMHTLVETYLKKNDLIDYIRCSINTLNGGTYSNDFIEVKTGKFKYKFFEIDVFGLPITEDDDSAPFIDTFKYFDKEANILHNNPFQHSSHIIRYKFMDAEMCDYTHIHTAPGCVSRLSDGTNTLSMYVIVLDKYKNRSKLYSIFDRKIIYSPETNQYMHIDRSKVVTLGTFVGLRLTTVADDAHQYMEYNGIEYDDDGSSHYAVELDYLINGKHIKGVANNFECVMLGDTLYLKEHAELLIANLNKKPLAASAKVVDIKSYRSVKALLGTYTQTLITKSLAVITIK